MAGKAVEALTPDPHGPSATKAGHAGRTADTESSFAEILAGVVHRDQVPVDSHFFDELGADSLVMAQFCARVRKRADLPSVSMKDVYRHPTVRSLTTALADTAPAPEEQPVPEPGELVRPAGKAQYALCGTLQLLIFVAYCFAAGFLAVAGSNWISDASGIVGTYTRSVLYGGAVFLGLCVLPIVAKWTLIGRWEPHEIRIWSPAYFRFWCVKTLVRVNPLVLFVGSPLYVLYLRALGAKIGKDVVILSRHVPVCTDLLTIGAGTVIRKDSLFGCYQAEGGVIRTGRVSLGKGVVVGEVTVIDIGASMGDGSQLGHASSLYSGQAVPAGERWHGSPAQRSGTEPQAVTPAECGAPRRAAYAAAELLAAFLLYIPLAVAGIALLRAVIPQAAALAEGGSAGITTWAFYSQTLAVSAVLYFGSALAGLLTVVTVPRLLSLFIEPDRVYRLYGLHYGIHRTIALITNAKFFLTLFGDSSCIVHYLRRVGYDLSRVEQTGSNFGTVVKHENPYLSSVGSGTMVADGLSMMNADYSNTSFRVSRVSIGPHNFIGNAIAYPANGRTGDNCLIATKAMVPLDGEVREGVGLLGSPSFEIPRSVERDSRFDDLKTGEELRRRLNGKNKHNAATMGLHLLAGWLFFFAMTFIVAGAAGLYSSLGTTAVALAEILVLLFTVAYFVLTERIVTGFRGLRPLYCSIYDRRFWRHERYWKVSSATEYIRLFNGTPFKNVIWRLLGVRVGARVFDDGCGLPERSLVTIGDECTLNEGSTIQCHSQEDGTFKSDRSTIGAGCTLGVGALVHYAVTVGDGVVLGADSFLMKGEEVPRNARWSGNPAREIRAGTSAPPARPDGDERRC